MMRLLLVLFAAVLSTGCSSFHGKWKTALAEPVPVGGFAGPWEGRWISEKNGHTGRLRCVMSEASPTRYDAHFHATFWKIFRAAYEVPFAVTNSHESITFSGQADLGKMWGGVYEYQGSATPQSFTATYKSKYDHGKFEMIRPAQR